jgi:hypothetical protein
MALKPFAEGHGEEKFPGCQKAGSLRTTNVMPPVFGIEHVFAHVFAGAQSASRRDDVGASRLPLEPSAGDKRVALGEVGNRHLSRKLFREPLIIVV